MAARGETIIITTDPKGVFLEGVIASAEKPGTIMEIQTPFYASGRHLWRPYQPGTDGKRRLIAVLLADDNQGKTITDAYVANKRCRLYVPAAGEELNVLHLNVAGTADDIAVGDLLAVDSGTGKVQLAAGTEESIPFRALAALVDPTADELFPVMYTGY